MNHSSSPTYTNEFSTNENKRKRKYITNTMMTELTKVCNICVKLSIEFDHKKWTCYGKNVSLFRSYVMFFGRNKVSILLDDWSQASED